MQLLIRAKWFSHLRFEYCLLVHWLSSHRTAPSGFVSATSSLLVLLPSLPPAFSALIFSRYLFNTLSLSTLVYVYSNGGTIPMFLSSAFALKGLASNSTMGPACLCPSVYSVTHLTMSGGVQRLFILLSGPLHLSVVSNAGYRGF